MSLSVNSNLKNHKIRVHWYGLFDLNDNSFDPDAIRKSSETSVDFELCFGEINDSLVPDVVIVDHANLTSASINSQKSKIYLLAKKLSKDDFIAIYNKYSILGIDSNPFDAQSRSPVEILNHCLRSFVALQSNQRKFEFNFKQNLEKRKELERLNQELEHEVFERTKYIEVSTQEQSSKLNSERSLIRLIKDLSSILSVEDLLLLFRKEIRKFTYAGEPVLIFTADGKKQSWLQFKNGSVSSTSGIYENIVLDSVTRVDFASPAFLGVLANLVGRPVGRCLLIPLDLNLASNPFQRARAMFCVELFLTGTEAHEFFLFVQDRLEIFGMTLDRILLEYQLSTYSYRWEKTFDGLRDGIAIINSDFELLRANRRFYPSDEVRDSLLTSRNRGLGGMPALKCHEVFAQRSTPCVQCPFLDSASENNMTRIHFKEKSYEVFRYVISMQDKDAKSSTFVHQYVNVTEKEKLNTQLLQNEKMSSLGMLAGHLAHELNNPLSGILTLTQVILKQSEIQPSLAVGTVKSDVAEIQSATLRSLSIIRNLIDFSVGGGSEPVEVSIDSLVEKTIPFIKTALRNHRFFKVLNTKKDLIRVEPQLVQQVIFNLIKNASQSMDSPGTIKIFSQRKTNGEVELVVEDSGPGILDEHRERIFEAFFTTKKKGEGTGLGLNLSKTIVERFLGRLTFKSKLGVGTQFSICFPIVRSEE